MSNEARISPDEITPLADMIRACQDAQAQRIDRLTEEVAELRARLTSAPVEAPRKWPDGYVCPWFVDGTHSHPNMERCDGSLDCLRCKKKRKHCTCTATPAPAPTREGEEPVAWLYERIHLPPASEMSARWASTEDNSAGFDRKTPLYASPPLPVESVEWTLERGGENFVSISIYGEEVARFYGASALAPGLLALLGSHDRMTILVTPKPEGGK